MPSVWPSFGGGDLRCGRRGRDWASPGDANAARPAAPVSAPNASRRLRLIFSRARSLRLNAGLCSFRGSSKSAALYIYLSRRWRMQEANQDAIVCFPAVMGLIDPKVSKIFEVSKTAMVIGSLPSVHEGKMRWLPSLSYLLAMVLELRQGR